MAGIREPAVISVVTLIELEGGVDEADVGLRRDRLAVVLRPMQVLAFTEAETVAYGAIVRQLGYSRRKVLDRMIAAQAIVADAKLVTTNGADFRSISGLKLLEW